MGGSGHRMLGSCHRLSQPIHLSTTPLTAQWPVTTRKFLILKKHTQHGMEGVLQNG